MSYFTSTSTSFSHSLSLHFCFYTHSPVYSARRCLCVFLPIQYTLTYLRRETNLALRSALLPSSHIGYICTVHAVAPMEHPGAEMPETALPDRSALQEGQVGVGELNGVVQGLVAGQVGDEGVMYQFGGGGQDADDADDDSDDETVEADDDIDDKDDLQDAEGHLLADIDGNSDAQSHNQIDPLAPTKHHPRHDPNSLFIPEDSPSSWSSPSEWDDIANDVDWEDNTTAKPTRKRKRARDCEEQPSEDDLDEPEQSMQAAELQSMRQAQGDAPRKKKRATAPKAKAKAKAKTTPKASRIEKRRLTLAKKQKQKGLEQMAKQKESLFNSNVFLQQAGPDAPDQPTFRSAVKRDALRELIKSLPPELKKQATRDKSNLEDATKEFNGTGEIRIDPNNHQLWRLKGFKTPLKSYQVFGVAFMRKRENSKTQPKGGLMADQMGLGKTVMMLASMTNGQRPENARSRKPKTTLIVASPAILTQWQNEIEQHSNFGWLRYGAGTRIYSSNNLKVLLENDIVLTTYNEVMRSYPKNDPPANCTTAEQKEKWWEDTYEERRGVLHRIKFLRIVLDEAQAIKNHKSRTSLACRALMAKHRWALSGTPIQNSLAELYPYFEFIGVPDTSGFAEFKSNLCNPKHPEKMLQQLSKFMIRRTHEDKMFGAPILKLPEAGQTTFWCEFNSVERCIYDIVYERFVERINAWSRDGMLNKAYSNILV